MDNGSGNTRSLRSGWDEFGNPCTKLASADGSGADGFLTTLASVFLPVEASACDVGGTPKSLLNRSTDITNEKLKSIYNRNFRDGANIGSGSTADALRYENKTGKLVGEKSHSQKVQDSINALKKLKRNPNANLTDVEISILEGVLKDLENAKNGN